jgi:RNA polymerase sigma factor (sigma-70 family)
MRSCRLRLSWPLAGLSEALSMPSVLISSSRFAARAGNAYPVRVERLAGTDDMAQKPLADAFLSHRAALLRYLRARGAAQDAEDLLQELWLKIGHTVPDGIGEPLSYLYRMAHNLMLDRHRGSSRRQRREERYQTETRGRGEADDAPAAERSLLARENLHHIDRALAALGPRTDHIFRRFRVEGVAQRVIADELGITLSAVEKHLQKAYRAVAAAQRAYAADEPLAANREHADETR